MMKKMLFLVLFLVTLGTLETIGQVRIGGNGKPNDAAVLDLNANDDATPAANKGAFALPRVTLTSETMQLNGAMPVNGMLIYNTGTTLPAGIYVWITDKWIATKAETLKITQQPAPFSFSRLYEQYGDPNGPATATAITLSVTATGVGALTYAWYEKPKNQNITDRGTKLASSASYIPPVTAWGMHTYYCVVSNGTDSVVSNYADVAIGCGAKTMDGRWLSFMCYNLGADPSLDPFTYTSLNDTTSFDSKGWLFQWGRVADGHQWRSSATVAGPVYLPSQWQVPAADTSGTSTSLGITAKQPYANYYGKFITTGRLEYFADWRTPQVAWSWYSGHSVDDPCPSGWQLPTFSDFGTIFSAMGNSSQTGPSAVANTWIWTTSGRQIRPDGRTTTMFLPAGGNREDNGGLHTVGLQGSYATSTSNSTGCYYMYTAVSTGQVIQTSSRGQGRSVRCVTHP